MYIVSRKQQFMAMVLVSVVLLLTQYNAFIVLCAHTDIGCILVEMKENTVTHIGCILVEMKENTVTHNVVTQ